MVTCQSYLYVNESIIQYQLLLYFSLREMMMSLQNTNVSNFIWRFWFYLTEYPLLTRCIHSSHWQNQQHKTQGNDHEGACRFRNSQTHQGNVLSFSVIRDPLQLGDKCSKLRQERLIERLAWQKQLHTQREIFWKVKHVFSTQENHTSVKIKIAGCKIHWLH